MREETEVKNKDTRIERENEKKEKKAFYQNEVQRREESNKEKKIESRGKQVNCRQNDCSLA